MSRRSVSHPATVPEFDQYPLSPSSWSNFTKAKVRTANGASQTAESESALDQAHLAVSSRATSGSTLQGCQNANPVAQPSGQTHPKFAENIHSVLNFPLRYMWKFNSYKK